MAIIAWFLVTSRRLPAPIQELAESPTPPPKQSEKAKSKRDAKTAPVKKTDAEPNSLSKFEGTWSGSVADNSAPAHHVGQYRHILVIANGNASLTTTFTESLLPGQVWRNALEGYETASPVVTKFRRVSSDLRTEGSNLRIKWPGYQILDWSPKSAFSAESIGQLKASWNQSSMAVYTFRGNQLTREFDSNGGATYTRVR